MKFTEQKLQSWKEQDNYQSLINALQNGVYNIRILAAQLLVKFKNPDVKDALLSALEDKVPTVSEAAYQSLKEFELNETEEIKIEKYKILKTSTQEASKTSVEKGEKNKNKYKNYSKTSLFKLYLRNEDEQEQVKVLEAIEEFGGIDSLKQFVLDEYQKKINSLSKEKLVSEYENRDNPFIKYFSDVLMDKIESFGGIENLKTSISEEKKQQQEQHQLKQKRRKKITVYTTITVLVILFILFGFKKYQSYTTEKNVYIKAIQDTSLVEMRLFIKKYPDGFFHKKVNYLIALKEYESIEKSCSYISLKRFAEKYKGIEFADLAYAKIDSINNIFQSDTKLKFRLQKLYEAVNNEEINLALMYADSIYTSTPEISSSYDFLQLRICDTLCSIKTINESYNPDLSVKERLKFSNIMSQLYLVSVKYQRYDIAKACLLRSIIEISPYYEGEYTLRFYRLMQQSFSSFGDFMKYDLETIEKCISLKDDVVNQIQQMENEQLMFTIADIFFGKSFDDLLANDAINTSDLGNNEKKFIQNVFKASLSSEVNGEIKSDIFNYYSHPEAFNYVASNSSNYINYRLTNLTNSMNNEIQNPLLMLIDTGSTAQRINAIIALGWIPINDTIKENLSKLYPVNDPIDDDKITEKMAISFVYQKTGINNNISYIVKNAKSGDYEIASRALSLLRYTRNKIPSAATIEIIKNVSSSTFYDQEFLKENNPVVKAVGINKKYKLLAEVVENAKYNNEIGEYIFSFASQAYDGGEGTSIRQQWIETATHFKVEILDLAKSKLFSDNILESKLALQIILLNDEACNQLDIENEFSSKLLPLWSKNKYSFFHSFVKKEAKSELAQQKKTTFYPYYIDYDKAYRKLRNIYYDDVIKTAKMLYYIKFGVNTNKLSLIENFDNSRLITLLSLSDSSVSFINTVKNKFYAGNSKKYKIHYAALLTNQGNTKGLTYMLDMLNNSKYFYDATFYLKYVNLNQAQLKIVNEKLSQVTSEIESLNNLYQKSNEKDSDFKKREKKLFVDKYYVQFHLIVILAKHSAFKNNLTNDLLQVADN